MTTFAGGASAASRNFVNKIAAFFRIPKFHTQYPSDDVDFMLSLAVAKARNDVGLEDNEAEKLRIERTSLVEQNRRLLREKLLSDRSAEHSFMEAEKLRAENKVLKVMVRALGGVPPLSRM